MTPHNRRESPQNRRLKRAVLHSGLAVAITAALFSENAILVGVVFGILVIAGASAIAGGGRSTRRETCDEGNAGVWARDVLAYPLWVETLALSMEFLSVSVGMILGYWVASPEYLPPLTTFLLDSAPILLLIVLLGTLSAFAITVWERRDAQKLLQSHTETS